MTGDAVKYPYWSVDTYGPDVETQWKLGNVCLKHCITPDYVAVKKEVFVELLKTATIYNFDAWDKIENDIETEMYKVSDEIESSGILSVGLMFGIGVADGSAHYKVVKVNKKSVVVDHRKFGDGYSDRFLGGGRKLSMEDFISLSGWRPGRKKVFGAIPFIR